MQVINREDVGKKYSSWNNECEMFVDIDKQENLDEYLEQRNEEKKEWFKERMY